MPAGASPEAADVRRRQARSAKHRRASVTHFMSQNGELASKTILFFWSKDFLYKYKTNTNRVAMLQRLQQRWWRSPAFCEEERRTIILSLKTKIRNSGWV